MSARPIAETASRLQERIGQRLVAYAVGVSSPRLVGRWANDTLPSDEVVVKLRQLDHVVDLICAAYSAETARAWLMGMNDYLDDQAPIEVIRDGQGAQAMLAADVFCE
jgi:uncharacterized protein (DUF2384 family)